MTSFAATGWQEENGAWVYYDRNGDQVTDQWAKSDNNWDDIDTGLSSNNLFDDEDQTRYFYFKTKDVYKRQ